MKKRQSFRSFLQKICSEKNYVWNEKSATQKNSIKIVQYEKNSNMKLVQHVKKATLKKCYMKIVQHGKSATRKKCNIRKECNMYEKSTTPKECYTKKVKHEKSTARRKNQTERHSERWEECDMEKVQHEESATLKECNTKKVLHGKSAKQKSATGRKYNMRKMQHAKNATRDRMQHDQSIVTEWNFKKIVQEECTWMHKQITGCPLTDRYTLAVAWWRKVRKKQRTGH